MKVAFTDKEKELVRETILRAFVDADLQEQTDRIIALANLLGFEILAKTMEENNRFKKAGV